MSMLSRLAVTGGAEVTYADIQVVDRGATPTGSDVATFNVIPQQNDVIIMFLSDEDTNSTYTIPAGYVTGANATAFGTSAEYSWYYKVVGSTPDTNIDLNNNNADGIGLTYYILRNVDTANVIMTSAVAAGVNNPPSITTTRKSLVIAALFAENNNPPATAPTGYSGFTTAIATSGSDVIVASAVKYVSTATTEDPGAFGATSGSLVSLTVALNPKQTTDPTRALPSFVSANSGTTLATFITVSAPANIQDGDLLVAIGALQATSRLAGVPSGFKIHSIQTNATQPGWFFIATKTASSESGSYTFTQAISGANARIAILVYRNATKVNCIGTGSWAAATTITAGEILPTSRGVNLAAFFNDTGGQTITTPPSGMTSRIAATGAVNFAIYEDNTTQEAVPTLPKSIVWSSSTGGKVGIQLQVSNEVDIEPELVGATHSQYSASGTSLVIDKPYETIEGDLMIAIATVSGGVSTWTGPAGWTEVADITNGRPITAVYYKVAGASETGPYTFTAGTSRILSGCILTYRYAAYSQIGAATSGADPLLLPSITLGNSQSRLIAVAGRDAASITINPTVSMTQIVQNGDATGQSYVVCDVPASKGPTGTRRFSVGSTTNVNGIMAAIRPSGATKAAAPALTALSYITATVATAPVSTSTILVPYNVQAGDLLVWSEYTPNYSSGSVPTGFTELVDTTANAVRHRTAYKIATGSEAGTVITGTTGSSGAPAALVVFRGSTPFVSASTGAWNSEGLNDGDPAQQTVIPPGSGLVLVLAATGARNALANIAFTTQSPSFDRVISHVSPGQDGLSVGYKIYTSGGSTHTIDVADSGTRNTLHSGYLQLTT